MKWEYKITRTDFDEGAHPEVLALHWSDEMGKDEWELVSVSDGVAYFKRPIFEPNNLHLPEGAQYMGDITDKITFGVEVRNEGS